MEWESRDGADESQECAVGLLDGAEVNHLHTPNENLVNIILDFYFHTVIFNVNYFLPMRLMIRFSRFKNDALRGR